MKPLILFLAIATPLWIFAQGASEKPPADKPNAVSERLNEPPVPDGGAAGRFQVAMLNGQNGTTLAIRVDTATGETWTMNCTVGEGNQLVTYWNRTLEPAALEELQSRTRAPSPASK